MALKNLAIVRKQIGDMVTRNSPTILTSLGVGGMLTTVIMAVNATPKALRIIDLERYDRAGTSIPIKKMEVIKLVWKCYIPTTLMGLVTISCIIGANHINLRRNSALASIYSIAETTLKEYQAKVLETIGEKKEAKLKDAMDQDKLDENPVTNNQIIITGNGDTLCFDSLSGRYFKNNIETIRKLQNDFNQDLIHDMYRSLNEFYDALALEHTELGNIMGWTTDYGLLDISFSAKIATDGQPCIVLNYRIGPRKL